MSDRDFSSLVPGADRPRGRRGARRANQGADGDGSTQSEGVGQGPNAEGTPDDVTDSAESGRTGADTTAEPEVARPAEQPDPGPATPSDPDTVGPEDGESSRTGPAESANNGGGVRGTDDGPRRMESRSSSVDAGGSRVLPEGKNSPMSNRTEQVVPSHYTLPESHTIVVDEIRAVLRRPPYRYTKRQASQSNVVALAIERLYEDVTGERMPHYGSEDDGG